MKPIAPYESGREEVYVRSFPDLERKWAVSVNGGNEPMWSQDGTEIFYRRGEAMMAVAVSGGEGFRASAPRKLFEGNFRRAVLNWFQELERLVPAGE